MIQTLAKYVARYCEEYDISYDRDLQKEYVNPIKLPLRINEILFSFDIGIKKIENITYIYIEIPVMEIPVEKMLLPLYRKLLEINYYLKTVFFSLRESTIYLSYYHPSENRMIYTTFKYNEFKNVMNNLYSILNKYAEYLFSEFGEKE